MSFTMHIPRDFELLPEFRELLSAMRGDRAHAVFTFNESWRELAYAAEAGESGVLSALDARRLAREVGEAISKHTRHPAERESEQILPLLTSAGVLTLRPDGAYFSDPFSRYNPHLDSRWVAPGRIGRTNAAIKKITGAARKSAPTLREQLEKALPERAWHGTSQDRERALVIIWTLDGIVRRPTRMVDEFEAGMVTDACRVVLRFTNHQIETVLKRAHLMRSQGKLPHGTTANWLRDWDGLMLSVLPTEGFIQWEKRTSERRAA